MKLQHNMSSINIYRNTVMNQQQSANSLEKLATGFRVNRAADDAAGLAISEKMRGQIRGLNMAQKNVQDGMSLIQVAEGALHESHSIIQRMRELAVQAANDTYVNEDRQALQQEVSQLLGELIRIADTTEFNTKKLLNGSLNNNTFQIGANSNQSMFLSIGNIKDIVYAHSETATVVSPPTGNTGGKLQIGDKIGTWKEKVSVELGVTFSFNEPTRIWTRDDNRQIIKDKETIALLDAQNIPSSPGIGVDDSTKYSVSFTKDTPSAYRVSYNTINGVTAWYTDNHEAIIDDNLLKKIDDLTWHSLSIGNTLYVTENDTELNLNIYYPNVAVLDVTTRERGYFEESTGDLLFPSDNDITAGHPVGETLILSGGVNVTTQEKANNSIRLLDDMITQVSDIRSYLGATQNRMEHTYNSLSTTSENLVFAESRIRDTDMAQEMMNFIKNNVLMQASQAMFAQSNQHPQRLLQLL